MNDKQVRLLAGLDQFAEHLFGRTVDPVDVLEQHNDRGRPASRFQKRRQQVARAQTDQNAVESRQRGFRRLQTQQIKQQAQILRRMKLQPAKARIQLSRDFGRIVLGSDPESAAHDLKERQKRNLLAVGRAMPDQDEGLVGLKALQKFRHEARLAQTGLGDEVDHLKPLSRTAKRVVELRQFVVATDMRTEAPAERGVEARAPLANGVQSPDFLGLGLALDRLLPVEARVGEPFNETSCGVADHGAARRRQALKTRGKIDGIADGGESGGFPLDWRHHGDSRTHAGAHERTLAELGLHLIGCRRKSRVDRQGRAAGSERGVFLRLGDAEHGHDAVAGEAAHRAAVFANGPRQFFVDYSDETEGSLLAKSLHNRRVSDHVREKYRDLTPFTQRRRCARGSTFCIFHGGNAFTRASASASSEHSGPLAESWSHLMIDGCSPYEPMRQIFATAW